MKKLGISILFIVLLPLLIFSREYVFDNVKKFQSVYLNGKMYLLVNGKDVNVDQYPELERYQNRSTDFSTIVLDNNGKIIRNNALIKKILLINRYSSMSENEINTYTENYQDLKDNSNQLINQDQFKSDHYFNSLNSLMYILDSNSNITKKTIEGISTQKLSQFIQLMIDNPAKAYQITLSEVLRNSNDMAQQGLKTLLKTNSSNINYNIALELKESRLGYAYGKATTNYIKNNLSSIEKLTNSFKISEEIINEIKTDPLYKNINNNSVIKQLTLTKIIFQKIYQNEQFYKSYLQNIQTEKKVLIQEDKQLQRNSVLASEFFPYYQSDYSQFTIPSDFKIEGHKILFYDDFRDGSLIRWNSFGPTQPTIKDNALLTNGNGWYYSGISSKVLFNPTRGNLSLESHCKIGEGKGSFGFGELKLGDEGNKGVLPFIGFIFNTAVEGSGTVDFRINNELIPHQFRIIVDLKKDHSYKILLHKESGVEFYIDQKLVFNHPFNSDTFGSESIVLSSKSNDYFWNKIVVYQKQ